MLWTQFLFFFSALGVFNGLLLVFYQLVLAKPRRTEGLLLGLLGLAFCIRVGISCIYYFQKVLPWTVVQIGLSAHVLIGPLLLAYIVHSWERLEHWKKGSRRVLLLSSLLAVVLGVLYPFVSHHKVWDFEIRYSLHAILSLFLIQTTYLLYFRGIKADHKPTWTRDQQFSLLIYVVAILICGGFAISLYVDYVLGPIISSFLFYSALIYWTLRKRSSNSPNYPQKILDPEALTLQDQLKAHILSTKCYRNPKLTIGQLAKQLAWPKARLSQLLNDNLGLSFTAYINEYRIEEAKTLLKNQHLFTVEAIGYEVGFGSRSSFFATFKQHTGLSPKKFQDSIRK